MFFGLGFALSKGAEYLTGIFTSDSGIKASVRMTVAGACMVVDPVGSCVSLAGATAKIAGAPQIDDALSLVGMVGGGILDSGSLDSIAWHEDASQS
jgi:arginine exporter protein ArgO